MTQATFGRRGFLKTLAAGIAAAVSLRMWQRATASETAGTSPHK